MFKRALWLLAACTLITSAFVQSVNAKPAPAKVAAPAKSAAPAASGEAAGGEEGLDLTLRTKAAAMPVATADGSAIETPASHAYLIDTTTGTVLLDKAGEEKMYPSSMTKMMTLYIIFERLKEGTLSLNNQFTVSEKTWVNWNNKGSSMFLPINSQVSLEDLIRGIAIQSGNDACVVAAEGIAGSEDAFGKLMNDKAKTLGMTNSNFTDSTGWPNPNHTTTPHDLAVLGEALIRDFPQYYHYFSEREFTFHNIRQYNRNLLLGSKTVTVDGLKTGHTDAAGYGITVSGKEGNRRLVLVVNGLNSEADRATEAERLLLWGFRNFDNKLLFKAGAPVVKANVWMGNEKQVELSVAKDVLVTLPKANGDKLNVEATYMGPIAAPVIAGQQYGTMKITLPGGASTEVPLVASANDEKLSFFGRFKRKLGL